MACFAVDFMPFSMVKHVFEQIRLQGLQAEFEAAGGGRHVQAFFRSDHSTGVF